MSWVQIGRYKLHTLQMSYVENLESSLRVHFTSGAPIVELTGEEARLLWKYLKADNPMAGPERGSTMVLPRVASAVADSARKPPTVEVKVIKPPAPSPSSISPPR